MLIQRCLICRHIAFFIFVVSFKSSLFCGQKWVLSLNNLFINIGHLTGHHIIRQFITTTHHFQHIEFPNFLRWFQDVVLIPATLLGIIRITMYYLLLLWIQRYGILILECFHRLLEFFIRSSNHRIITSACLKRTYTSIYYFSSNSMHSSRKNSFQYSSELCVQSLITSQLPSQIYSKQKVFHIYQQKSVSYLLHCVCTPSVIWWPKE